MVAFVVLQFFIEGEYCFFEFFVFLLFGVEGGLQLIDLLFLLEFEGVVLFFSLYFFVEPSGLGLGVLVLEFE